MVDDFVAVAVAGPVVVSVAVDISSDYCYYSMKYWKNW